VHLAGEGFEARFVTASGEVARQGTFRDTLLDTLAVLQPSRSSALESGLAALSSAGGQLIAVLGDLSVAEANEVAAARRGNAPGVALLLTEAGGFGGAAGTGTVKLTPGAQVLVAAGWRVAVVPDAARLATAWQELHRAGGQGLASPDTASAVASTGRAGREGVDG
jgi:hypothetical protein